MLRNRKRPKHYGFVRNPGTTSVGFGRRGTPDGRRSSLPFRAVAAGAADPGGLAAPQRVGRAARGPALRGLRLQPARGLPGGRQGLAQFMPSTARSYGLRAPFDPEQSIDAQARLMRDLLRRFASVPLALAAYNAGPAAVARCGCIPPYAETQAYISRILGLFGGAGDPPLPSFGVHLVEYAHRYGARPRRRHRGAVGGWWAPGGPSDRRGVNQSDVEEPSDLADDGEWIKVDVERAEAHLRAHEGRDRRLSAADMRSLRGAGCSAARGRHEPAAGGQGDAQCAASGTFGKCAARDGKPASNGSRRDDTGGRTHGLAAVQT
jgi:Transglycosylase SLT domain